MASGVVSPNFRYPKPKSRVSNNLTPQQAYSGSIEQTGEDYDSIMGGYKGILDDPNRKNQLDSIMGQYKNLLANPVQYQRGPEVGAAMSNLSDLASTGGYSERGKSDIRERGLSPIRSVYANAMQDVNRQKSLQGGYSPNYTASMTKMGRDLSSGLSDASTNVNAKIAEMVAQGRQQSAPAYASAASAENQLMNQMRANQPQQQMNILGSMQGAGNEDFQKKMSALQGMTSLYGTTPALASTFGNQVLNFEGQNLQKENMNQNANIALMNAYQPKKKYGTYTGPTVMG